MFPGSFSQEAEHRSQTLFVVGALLEVTQTTDTSQAETMDRFYSAVHSGVNMKDHEIKAGWVDENLNDMW